jgi:hypothetical protein
MLLNLPEPRLPRRSPPVSPSVSRGTLPVIADGSLEALKWLALVLMTLDHINKYLLHAQMGWMFSAGRVVMPIFSFVLAYNLARPERQAAAAGDALAVGLSDQRSQRPSAARRTAFRLALFGLCATPMSWALIGPWPLNVFFMLASAAGVIALLQRGARKTAWVLGLFSGLWVEFWWPAIGATVAAWHFCKTGSRTAVVVWLACLWSLTLINGNLWALAAVPLIGAASRFSLSMPRAKWWFYAYYPAHLLVLLLAARTMA